MDVAFGFAGEMSASVSPQRARGKIDLAFHLDEISGQTRIAKFYQAGCLKARRPRAVDPFVCEVVLINLSGGIAGGDDLSLSIAVQARAQACVAAQAAERVYRALPGEISRLVTSIHLENGASLDYLPQEAILFDGFALSRTLDINMAADARYLGVESFVLGRAAMGETVQAGYLRDRISLRREGRLLYLDMTRLEGNLSAHLQRKAVANGASAMASFIYIGPDSASRLDQVRAAMLAGGCEAGATVFEGVLLARLLAPSSAALRKTVADVLKICRDGRALPRVWQG